MLANAASSAAAVPGAFDVGRPEVMLAGDQAVRAHLPLAEPAPRPRERHTVRLDPALATLIAGAGR